MINRALNKPADFGADAEYIFACLQAVAQTFGLNPCPQWPNAQIPVRALLQQLLVWWRTLEPRTDPQEESFRRLPGVIRLIDTFSTWLQDSARAER